MTSDSEAIMGDGTIPVRIISTIFYNWSNQSSSLYLSYYLLALNFVVELEKIARNRFVPVWRTLLSWDDYFKSLVFRCSLRKKISTSAERNLLPLRQYSKKLMPKVVSNSKSQRPMMFLMNSVWGFCCWNWMTENKNNSEWDRNIKIKILRIVEENYYSPLALNRKAWSCTRVNWEIEKQWTRATAFSCFWCWSRSNFPLKR